MSVGIAKIELSIDYVRTLKEKRSIIQPLIVKIRNNYNVSIAELDGIDEKNRAILGIAHISQNGSLSNKKISKIITEIEKSSQVMLVNYSLEII